MIITIGAKGIRSARVSLSNIIETSPHTLTTPIKDATRLKAQPIKTMVLPAVLLCYPALLFTMKGGMSALFFVIAALCLALFFKQACSHAKHDVYAIAFMVAMSSGIAAIFLSQAYHSDFNLHPYDAAFRLLLAIPIYHVLRKTDIRILSAFQYGLPLGTIAALVMILLMHGHYFYPDRASTAFMHPIYFGDLALIVGFLSLFSMHLFGRDRPLIVLLKFIGCLSGIYLSLLSQSRGGWLAIPVLLTVWLILQNNRRQFIKLSYAIPLLLLSLLASYFFIDIVQQRIGQIYSDLAAFANGQTDTSVGQRLQLWKAALYLYSQSPLFGVGPEGFANSMSALSQAGLITQEAAQLGRGEVHSQILSSLVALGVPGLFSILSIYFVPFFIFWKSAKSDVNVRKTAGMMGICLTLGFLIFGLTVETFNIKMIVYFYSLTLAVLLAIATHQDKTSNE